MRQQDMFINVQPRGMLLDGTWLPDVIQYSSEHIDPGNKSKSFAAWKARRKSGLKKKKKIQEMVEKLEAYLRLLDPDD